MGPAWQVFGYQTDSGVCEVKDFIESRKREDQQKLLAWLALLEIEGPQLPRPYADLLRDGIHELRVKLSGNQIRILYFFFLRNKIMLTHTFSKTSAKVPDEEVRKAMKIRDIIIHRYKTGGENLAFPRLP